MVVPSLALTVYVPAGMAGTANVVLKPPVLFEVVVATRVLPNRIVIDVLGEKPAPLIVTVVPTVCALPPVLRMILTADFTVKVLLAVIPPPSRATTGYVPDLVARGTTNVITNPPELFTAHSPQTCTPLKVTDNGALGVKFNPVTLTVLPGAEVRGLRRTFGAFTARGVEE